MTESCSPKQIRYLSNGQTTPHKRFRLNDNGVLKSIDGLKKCTTENSDFEQKLPDI